MAARRRHARTYRPLNLDTLVSWVAQGRLDPSKVRMAVQGSFCTIFLLFLAVGS